MLTGLANHGDSLQNVCELVAIGTSSALNGHDKALRRVNLKRYLLGSAAIPNSIDTASCLVRILRQVAQQSKKRRRLADEEPHVGQKFDHAHSSPFCLCGSDN